MDRGAWQAIVHGVVKSRVWLSDFHFHIIEQCLLTDAFLLYLVSSFKIVKSLGNETSLIFLQGPKACDKVWGMLDAW